MNKYYYVFAQNQISTGLIDLPEIGIGEIMVFHHSSSVIELNVKFNALIEQHNDFTSGDGQRFTFFYDTYNSFEEFNKSMIWKSIEHAYLHDDNGISKLK